MIKLFQFQEEAVASIADRFIAYLDDPVRGGTEKNPSFVPFFQALSALTGSGKTAIMAGTIAQVAAALPTPPVVLWLSRGKVVVRQSFANLSAGGKYHHLLDGARVIALGDFKPTEAASDEGALICFATVGTFNQKDKEEGSLTIYASDVDNTETSVWEALRLRTTADGIRRPLIVAYDEAHYLSDQQTELLMELEPDGFLLASATMKWPQRLLDEVEALRRVGWSDDSLVTRVSSREVVASGLVKSTVALAGYNSPMEETVSTMLADMGEAEAEADSMGLPFRPKAIYVCNTNVVADNAYQMDDHRAPFKQRQAPPILIWRYLTERCGIDASRVAVYADLKTHRDAPLPDEFVLYKGGDNDYEAFASGDYKHIIFNLSLQEGWDDPAAYFAYVDKSMGSKAQVTQVIGRVLRQPGATHYQGERLNTAHFYVRVDRTETFNEVLADVGARLGADVPEVTIVANAPGRVRPRELPPRESHSVPRTALDSTAARMPVEQLIGYFTDYRNDQTNATGEGSRRLVRQRVASAAEAQGEWEVFEQSSRVSARWVLHREVQRRFRPALNVVSLADPKLDALVGIGSPAYRHVCDLAEQIVGTFLENVRLKERAPNPYVVGPVLVRMDESLEFMNSLHARYSGLNADEKQFARAIDGSGLPWCRNPSRSGYGIPLVSVGETDNFYPDFLIWTEHRVICVDTKGPHLVAETAMRKLLRISPRFDLERNLDIQFVTPGKWNRDLEKVGPDGVSRWALGDDGRRRIRHFEGMEKLVENLIID